MEHAIFALEVCARLDQGSPLQRALRGLATGYGPRMNLQQKWRQYREAAGVLFNHLPLVERGCWDYFDDHARAQRDFDMWTKGMTTEEGARQTPSGSPDPYRGQPRYLTFTMAFLIAQGSPTNQAIASVCKVPEAALWKRGTFGRLLQGMGYLNFASVAADVSYLIPRDEGFGLTAQDLDAPKFHYLRQVE
jgi:hypothetical protein